MLPKIRDVTVDKVGFTDDVTLLTSDVERASNTVQNVQKSSSKGGLYVSVRKSFAQHIDRCSEAPTVTPKDIESLKLTRECPKPWCTRRFGTMKEVQSHALWHAKYEGGVIDSERLSVGTIVSARGPPEHRFFLVHWSDGQIK